MIEGENAFTQPPEKQKNPVQIFEDTLKSTLYQDEQIALLTGAQLGAEALSEQMKNIPKEPQEYMMPYFSTLLLLPRFQEQVQAIRKRGNSAGFCEEVGKAVSMYCIEEQVSLLR